MSSVNSVKAYAREIVNWAPIAGAIVGSVLLIIGIFARLLGAPNSAFIPMTSIGGALILGGLLSIPILYHFAEKRNAHLIKTMTKEIENTPTP